MRLNHPGSTFSRKLASLSDGDISSHDLFIGQSMCVDNLKGEVYISNSRRNGIDIDFNNNSKLTYNSNEYLTGLVQFKKKYKNKSSAVEIENSEEMFVVNDKIKHRSLTDLKKYICPTDIKITKILKHAKQQQEDTLDYYCANNITLMKDTVNKLYGIKEICFDKRGNVIKKIEINKLPGLSLGFYIRIGNGIDRNDGVFVSRVTLGSFADLNNLLYAGDEILCVNQHEVKGLSLEEVVSMMQKSNTLRIETKSAMPLLIYSKPKLRKTNTPTEAKSSYIASNNQLLHEDQPKSGLVHSLIKEFEKKKTSSNSSDALLRKHKRFTNTVAFKTISEVKNTMTKKFTSERNLLRPKQNIISLWTKEFDLDCFNKVKDTSSFPDINKGARIYKSDKLDSLQRKTFTGSLHVSFHKITGCRQKGCFSCCVDIDGEDKAKTSEKMIKEGLIIEESFEIEINEASLVELNLFLNKEKIDIGKIYLGKLLAYENKTGIILITDKLGINLNMSVEFIGIDTFLKRAPSKRLKGLFGFTIAQTLIDDGNTIPLIVRKCVHEIEMRGFHLEGIYRISGNARKKKILKAKFEEKVIENDNIDEFDCHVISGVLKDYLRELPEPLIPQNLFLKLYEKSLQGSRSSFYDIVLLDAMKNVHYSNRATLIYIMEHLLRVASRNEENKMDFKNIAVCFGPVIICPPALNSGVVDFKKQVDALEYLLEIWPKSSPQNQV